MALWDWNNQDFSWSFVVDTDQYAGNFERELTAYVIGQADEYANVDDYIAMFEEECGFDFEDLYDTRVSDPGDDGIMRAPNDLAPTPGWSNDGHGGHYRVDADHPFKHPAYQSVAIFLSREPTSEELAELVKRATSFSQLSRRREWDDRPTILGCRLVKERLELIDTLVWSPP